MKKTITSVAEGMIRQIKDYGLKEPTILLYQNVCNTIINYITQNGDGYYSEKILDDYISNAENRAKNNDICNEYLRLLKRTIRMLKTFAVTGQTDFARSYSGRKYIVSENHSKLILSILENFKLVGESRHEIDIVMRHFLHYIETLEINDCNISDTNFFSFLSVVSESNKGSMGRTLRALKYLSAFLKENGIAELKADLSMLTLKTAPVKLIPVYSQEEISNIISVIDFETLIGIRDNSILLLAFETGLRGIDIKNLKFTDIDWNKGEVSVIQRKTKEPLKLPLNGKVMNAVADYILKARPVSDCPQIFLTTKGPAKPFSDASALDAIIDKYSAVSGVRKKPMRSFHSLRRSFATELSLAEVPLPTISQMLGHKNINEDKPYLSYNRTQVAFCAMDFSDVPIKNGIYKNVRSITADLEADGDVKL